MGDRANIYIVDTADEAHGIYLYTHWGGSEWPVRLAEGLHKGRDRWGDEQYLARIIASHVFADYADSTTGAGLSTYRGDNEYPIIIADLRNSTVGFAEQGSEGKRSSWYGVRSFEDFIATPGYLYGEPATV